MSGPLDFEDKPHRLTVHVRLTGDRGDWTGDEYTVHHDDCPIVERYEDVFEPGCFTYAWFGGEFGGVEADSLMPNLAPGEYTLLAGQEQTAVDDAQMWLGVAAAGADALAVTP